MSILSTSRPARRAAGPICLLLSAAVLLPRRVSPQSLADLRWTVPETETGRFLIVPGERAFVAGYNAPGLEVWAYPVQIVRDYWIGFRVEGDSADVDGRKALRAIEQTPIAATRIYTAPGIVIRERVFTPVAAPGATISYTVESSRPVLITVHFTPSLNLMWPGAVGGQELHWDAAHSAYTLDEPSHRFRAAILARQIAAHDEPFNNRRDANFERSVSFRLRVPETNDGEASVIFAGTTASNESAVRLAENVASQAVANAASARDRYANVRLTDIETPDSAVNRALRWAQVTLEQAWVCNPQLGCGLVAGYGPSRGARRPQYAWFFAGDGLVAVDALLREGAYARARDELAFILRYQSKRTGAIWHELSQSAGFLDWEGAYPYMFVHVDVSFDFLNTVRDYVQTTGDSAFVAEHWTAIRAVYDYCRSTLPPNGVLPEIPAGQQGRDEQDPQRDELTLSLAWVHAAASFGELARITHHDSLAAEARAASTRARNAVRLGYFDANRARWMSGHLRSGAPVEGLTSSLTALLHDGLLSATEQSAVLDALASPTYRAPWGIRSTPADSPLYDPDSYARGSVWAIGTTDAAMALWEGRRTDAGTALWRDLVPWFGLDAPGHMHEVIRGDVFAPERESVPDQTWSAAAFLSSAVRGLLGIAIDASKRELTFAPALPTEWDGVRIHRVDIGGAEVALTMRTSASAIELTVDNSGPPITVAFRPSLTKEQARVRCPARQTTRITLRRSR